MWRLLEREIDEEGPNFIKEEGEVFLGIDEHSFRHQDMVHTVTEVKRKKILGILRDDRIATLKALLRRIPKDKVKKSPCGGLDKDSITAKIHRSTMHHCVRWLDYD